MLILQYAKVVAAGIAVSAISRVDISNVFGSLSNAVTFMYKKLKVMRSYFICGLLCAVRILSETAYADNNTNRGKGSVLVKYFSWVFYFFLLLFNIFYNNK